jgi:hypothetical protein
MRFEVLGLFKENLNNLTLEMQLEMLQSASEFMMLCFSAYNFQVVLCCGLS